MFGKCLKYELRSTARTILPLFIAVIVLSLLVGVGFCVDGRLIPEAPEGETSAAEAIFSLVQGLLLFALVMGLMAVSIAVFVVLIRRYYVSFFSDEGYLTFTLPVSADCHLMTKVVSMAIWNLASAVVTVLAVLILLGGVEIGYGGVAEAFAGMDEAFAELGMVFETVITIPSVIMYLLSGVVTFFLQILVIYFSISLGCMMTKKHRVLVSLLCLFGINTVRSIVSGIIRTILTVTVAVADSAPVMLTTTMSITTLLLSLIELVACYLGTRWILTKKLNLD